MIFNTNFIINMKFIIFQLYFLSALIAFYFDQRFA